MNIRNAIAKYATALEPTADGQLILPDLPDAAQAFVTLAVQRHSGQTALWVLESSDALENAHRNLTALANHKYKPAYFPPSDSDNNDPETFGQRLRVLRQLESDQKPDVVITCIQALLQLVPSRHKLTADTILIEVDCDIDLEQVTEKLQANGYCFQPEVHEKGEVSLRGGLLDIWPPTASWPQRIELFGPTIESIRTFDPTSQRSIEKLPATEIPPAQPPESAQQDRSASLADYLPETASIIWSDPASIKSHAIAYAKLDKMADSEFNIADFEKRIHPALTVTIAPETAIEPVNNLPQIVPLKHSAANSAPAPLLTNHTEQNRTNLIEHIRALAAKRHHVELFCGTKGTLEHVTENLLRPIMDPAKAHPRQLSISGGFEIPKLRLAVVAENDLFGQRKTLSRRYNPDDTHGRHAALTGRPITDFTDIEPGDLVVHIEHGIGRFIGTRTIEFNNRHQEVLAIEYADDAKLYVPLSHSHLLSRYVGISYRKAHLHKLGGKRWRNAKHDAQQAVMDLAADLLEVQAARNLLQGHAFPSDNPLQHEFAAAFPYQETSDQLKVIEEIRTDMQSTRPMDRLICGDAGYGKTEVAMRAAFRTVCNTMQVAMLVPTTILAQQHFHTFTERMAGFGINIAMLSRFCTASQRAKTIKEINDGTTDIIIGTHALLSSQVKFKNIGLVIIDEEQRFGVKHKEHLKHLKKLVDVLTLSATPIPRTLYMSMTGARDMSLLQTPPRERMPIETIIATESNEIIRKAALRELRRGGQIYYLHNRVMTINRLHARLTKLLPEARIEVAHGQMKSSELAAVMERFVNGAFDLLLCTTIIESGMDIPRANTILIDRADRFGIADLYQLRGRVGRSHHKAYAYLLLPRHGYIDSDARERIRAIRKHSELGSGFNLAVRDMEIRGAGNILGAAQSGHIAAVGFGIYCQMLQRSIARLKGEKPPPLTETEVRLDFINLTPSHEAPPATAPAYIPHSYINNERLRLAVYRRLAESIHPENIRQLEQELRDRFGRLPQTVSRLLTIAAIRIAAAQRQIELVEVRLDKIIIKRNNSYTKQGTYFPSINSTDPDDKLQELKQFVESHS